MDGNDLAFTREPLHGTLAEPTYAGALSFMRRRYSRDFAGVDVAVRGIPFDTATTNRPGARFGPRGVRAASSVMAWDRPYGMEIDPFDVLAVVDSGDALFDFSQPADVPAALEEDAFNVIRQGPALMSIGGDHFVSYPLLRAHARLHDTPFSLLHFDAHTDTWSEESQGIHHGTMFYWAAKEGLIDPSTSVQIGIRTRNPDTLGFNIIDADRVQDTPLPELIDEIRATLGTRPVYVTFDIDCLDPAYAPGTGTPVCGGLTTSQAMRLLRGMAGIRIIGADLVEVAPAYDHAETTSLAAAHLMMEMMYLFARRP